MSLRLDPALAEHLDLVASVEGQSVADVIRQAIAAHVEARMRDPKFQRILERNIARHQRILDDLREARSRR